MATLNANEDATAHQTNVSLMAGMQELPNDQELDDWNAFYQMLLAGKLSGYGGQYVLIHRGSLVAHGADFDELRATFAPRLGVSGDRLVMPFVDGKECVVLA